jgi:TPP-dependent pyruvate/acetoin dehydrogenase alpha subunit
LAKNRGGRRYAGLTEEDNVLCTYREHGHALARGIDADVIMAEMYGKIEVVHWVALHAFI